MNKSRILPSNVVYELKSEQSVPDAGQVKGSMGAVTMDVERPFAVDMTSKYAPRWRTFDAVSAVVRSELTGVVVELEA